jgi:predicted AAA+ superfamily ATPase
MKKLLGLLLFLLPLLGGAQVRYPVAVSGFAVQPRIFVADYLMAGSGNIRAGFTFGDLSEASREVFLHLTIESSTAKLESNPQGYYRVITLNAGELLSLSDMDFTEYLSFDNMLFRGVDKSTVVRSKMCWANFNDLTVSGNVELAPGNTFALRILFKKLAESIKQPLSFTQIANIVSSTGAKVGTQTIINYTEYAKDAWLINPIQNIAGKLVDKETAPKYYYTDNGILNLFLLNGKISLLENLVDTNLLRKYGRNDAVYFYNQGIEVDFYIPNTYTAIQVCYNLDNSDGTLDREVKALVKITEVQECQNYKLSHEILSEY